VTAAPSATALRKMGRKRSLTAVTLPSKSTGSICEYSEVILSETFTRGSGPQALSSTTGTGGHERACLASSSMIPRYVRW